MSALVLSGKIISWFLAILAMGVFDFFTSDDDDIDLEDFF